MRERDRVLAWLEDNVPAARIKHILRVEQMSVDLANHYNLDVEKARSAGLMHDLAKYFKPEQLLQIARTHGLEIDEVCENEPHLLHAEIGAIVARDEFRIEDEQILEAIRNHTLGKPQMSGLSCVVFLADTLEPGRGNTPELAQLRETCRENLYKAVWLTSDYSLRYLLHHRRSIHPRTILTRNWALQRAQENPQSRLRHKAIAFGPEIC